MVKNKYLIKFCDRQTGQLLIPFGHIDNLVMPSVSYESQASWGCRSKKTFYIPGRSQLTPFSATYEDLENNQGGYFFYNYFYLERISFFEPPTCLCGSIWSSKDMKMINYFDDAFISSAEMRRYKNGSCALDFSLNVNDWEYL